MTPIKGVTVITVIEADRSKCKGLAMTRAKTKYRDLSTAQRTMRLSVASVEMTFVWG
jgi:hypothetical protein